MQNGKLIIENDVDGDMLLWPGTSEYIEHSIFKMYIVTSEKEIPTYSDSTPLKVLPKENIFGPIYLNLLVFNGSKGVIINNYIKEEEKVTGRVTLSRNDPIWILIYIGKLGGPYWLYGADGENFKVLEKNPVGNEWELRWEVSGVHLEPDDTDLRAVVTRQEEKGQFLTVGTPDSDFGGARKVENLKSLPEAKVISNRFRP